MTKCVLFIVAMWKRSLMGFVCSLFFSDNGTLIRRIGLHQLLIENKKSRGYFCSPNNVKVNVKTLVVDLKFVQFCRLFFSDNGTLIRKLVFISFWLRTRNQEVTSATLTTSKSTLKLRLSICGLLQMTIRMKILRLWSIVLYNWQCLEFNRVFFSLIRRWWLKCPGAQLFRYCFAWLSCLWS